MRQVLRRVLVTLGLPLVKLICRLVFDRRYLRGRHFEQSIAGWYWAWRGVWWQKVLGFNRHVPWPVTPLARVLEPSGIDFDPNDINNFQSHGCYFSNAHGGKIVIGRGTYIAPNVGIITTNHDPRAPDKHLPPQDVMIGEQCWIGMNAVILPGVVLGDRTVVAAGSVVGRSFRQGGVVLVGVPARVSLTIDEAEETRSGPQGESDE